MNLNEPDFIDVLQDRIEAIKPSVPIDPKTQLAGLRFKDTFLVIEAIQGALLVRNDPNLKGKVLPESLGLIPHRSDVLTGQFDPLIRLVLGQYAAMDFEAENRLDLH